MSEPSQLYARVRLSRPRLEEFLAGVFPDPSDDADVLAWLSSALYYGDRYTPQLIRERLASQTTVGAWVDWLTEPASHGFAMPSRNGYDDESQTWTLAVLDFSENYDDYLAAVAAFRTIAKYKDLAGDDGFLIFGYLFEESYIAAALRIGVNMSEFLDDSSAQSLVSEASAAMESLVAEGAAGADD